MKKRLLSLLVAISMVLTFLPVSALTAAAAEDSSNGELKIGQNCYPVLDNIPHQTVNEHDIYTGDGWTYDADENCKILTLCPSAPTNYDFFAIHTGHSITTDCNLVIGKNATVTDGNFIASVTNNDTIKGGIFKDAVTNHGTIIGGRFFSSVTNELDGIIENGQFGDWASSYTVTNNGGTINGGTFKEMSSIIGTGSVASGYTLAAETPSVFSSVSVNGYHNSCYIIPNQASVSVDISYRFDDTMYDLPPLDVTIDNAPPTLLSDWCGSDLKIEFDDIRGVYEVTFTAPPANGSTVTISPLTRLVIDKDGFPVTAQDWNGNRANYTGNGWNFDARNNTLTLTNGSYDFSGEENALCPLNPDVHLVVVKPDATLTGGAAGDGSGVTWQLTENTDDPSTYTLTIRGSGAMEDYLISGHQPWRSFRDQITSVVVSPGVTSIGSNVFDGCTSLNDISYSGTSESVIFALSGYVPTLVTFNYGDKVPEAERMIKVFVKTGGTLTAPTTIPPVAGYEFKGWLTEDGELYDFPGAPTGQLTLYANWEKIPEPKPEPKPEPEPEAPTYTLTVKGGTFTYNGGEAMTSANVPVDAEVKVTLNQSAVPEGMVFDLWAMDEASLLGNPAVAYNEESFTIPAGSVAKGSTVTVEAQYRDATIESEPSILGTAAIIGVAGAGTAVIVWQGYRIGMELYEKYFQPTPEETAAEQPAPEAPAAAAS